jgi:hypothetical protein
MRDVIQARPRLWQFSQALFLAGLLLVISLTVLYLNAQARVRGRGAFNCGELDQATVENSVPGDTIIMIQFETSSGGPVVIGKELTFQGGWLPKPGGDCDFDFNGDPVPEFFDTITETLVYFDYDPDVRSALPAPIDYSLPSAPIMIISPSLTSTLTLTQLQFDSNNDPSERGLTGVISNSAQVKLDQVTFANSFVDPTNNGTGLDLTITGGGRLNIGKAEFNQNLAQTDGGGARLILQNGGVAVITQALFTNANEARRGAGLYAEVRGGSHLTLSEVQFNEGSAGQTGGGFEIHVFDNSQVTIDKTQILSNTANNGNGGGGRIVIHSGFVTISNSSFRNNDAGNGRGGGLAIEGAGSGPSFLLLKNNVITGNTASVSHPNLYVTGAVTVLIRPIYLPMVRKKSG